MAERLLETIRDWDTIETIGDWWRYVGGTDIGTGDWRLGAAGKRQDFGLGGLRNVLNAENGCVPDFTYLILQMSLLWAID